MQIEWRGLWGYGEALLAQRSYRELVIGRAASGALWLLEHPPVVTLGRREVAVDEDRIRTAGYALVSCERGGLATCHEPGQLVGYLIRDVSGVGIRCAVHAIEAGLIGWLAAVGVEACRRAGAPGVWVGSNKIAALGLHVRRGVTIHGFALNLTNTLRGFELITPCGITDGGVTNVVRCAGASPSPEAAWQAVGAAVALAFDALDSPEARR